MSAAATERLLVTPEGVPLRLGVGTVGARFGALLIDLVLIVGAMVVLTLAALSTFFAIGESAGELVFVTWTLGMFLFRNAYFLLFEMSPRAATPGKRIVGLRVASRDGGRLRPEAVFTRNALRELELFLPITVMIGAGARGVDGWIHLAAVLWCLVFVLLPVFNRDKLRAGDIVAGTWVLTAPRPRLARDLAEEAAPTGPGGFTEAQLDAYGIHELHVLEQALRSADRATLRAIAQRIAAKIDHERGFETDREFLAAYYQAMRGRLESGLLMGRRRRDKHDR